MKKSVATGPGDALVYTHKKNMLENIRLPRIKNAQTWKSTVMPQRSGGGKPKGLLYRTQLSTCNQVPISHMPQVPKVLYYKFCEAKTVCAGNHKDDLGKDAELSQHVPVKFPPLKLKGRGPTDPGTDAGPGAAGRDHRVIGDGSKWQADCKCTRCKLMKEDFAENNENYAFWGQYPCIPDAIINRETETSSDSSSNSGRSAPVAVKV